MNKDLDNEDSISSVKPEYMEKWLRMFPESQKTFNSVKQPHLLEFEKYLKAKRQKMAIHEFKLQCQKTSSNNEIISENKTSKVPRKLLYPENEYLMKIRHNQTHYVSQHIYMHQKHNEKHSNYKTEFLNSNIEESSKKIETLKNLRETKRKEEMKLQTMFINAVPEIIEEDQDYLIQSLSDDEKKLVNEWIHKPDNTAVIKKFNIQITRRDLVTLFGGSWLNDQVVNFMINLIMELYKQKHNDTIDIYIHNTFFFTKYMKQGYKTVRRWSKNFDTFALKKLFIPVNLTNTHWTVLYVNIPAGEVCYYDSMSPGSKRYTSDIIKYLCEEKQDKHGETISSDSFKTIITDRNTLPLQNNCSDCGVFMLTYIYYLLFDYPFNFSCEDMQNIRYRMMYSIIRGELK